MDEGRMSPLDWALRPLRRYADFRGRAPRAEYWWWFLAVTVVGFAVGRVDAKLSHPVLGSYGLLGAIFTAAVVIPGVAVAVRRMHDSGRSGWWCLMKASGYFFALGGRSLASRIDTFSQLGLGLFITGFGVWLCLAIIFFVLLLAQGDQGTSRYGPDPYGRTDLEEVFA